MVAAVAVAVPILELVIAIVFCSKIGANFSDSKRTIAQRVAALQRLSRFLPLVTTTAFSRRN